VAVIIDTSDDRNIVETSDDTSDAAETQDTANVTNKFMLSMGLKISKCS